MILGKFGEIGELIFDIELIAVDGEEYSIELLLDTGFTTGWVGLDSQDIASLGWNVIEQNRTMRMARGEDFFNIYEGKVKLDGQEYIIPVLGGEGIPEPLLGLQWLKILPLAVNFSVRIQVFETQSQS